MKKYRVSYFLDNYYHSYKVDADNEYEAIEIIVRNIPNTSKPLLHDFKIEMCC